VSRPVVLDTVTIEIGITIGAAAIDATRATQDAVTEAAKAMGAAKRGCR